MVNHGRIAFLRHQLRTLRVDLALGGLGWGALLALANPRGLAELVGLERFDHVLAFDAAALTALLVFGVLTVRFAGRLLRAGRRVSLDPAERAIQGTVAAEFVLVLPIVLLLLGTVFQIALIANAALVVRYAAFAAARSAMVSFEADMGRDLASSPGASLLSLIQVPPFPEWVDPERPSAAALLVLAAISPRTSSASPAALAMQQVLEANGTSWGTGNYASRLSYAELATTIKTGRDRFVVDGDVIGPFSGLMGAWVDSFAPLIPVPEHALQPARQRAGSIDNAYLLPKPPPISEMLPDSIPIEIDVPLPSEADLVLGLIGVSPPKITFDIPMQQAKNLAAPLTARMDEIIETLRIGSASAIRSAASSWWNIDLFAPKEVEITLTYLFQLSVPSLIQLVPGITEPAPLGQGRAFKIEHPEHFTVRLQSTGGRRSLLGLIPKVLDIKGTFGTLWGGDEDSSAEWKTVPNTPLYWRSREADEDEEEDDEDDEDEDEDEEEDDDGGGNGS